jgi:superfamily II DNA or RNA helicase
MMARSGRNGPRPPVTLTDKLRDTFDPAVVNRGESYYTTGRVRLTRTQDGRIESRVVGSRPRPYAVVIEKGDRASAPPQVRCTCPTFRGGMHCKHIWATLITIDSADPPVWPKVIKRSASRRSQWNPDESFDDEDSEPISVDDAPGRDPFPLDTDPVTGSDSSRRGPSRVWKRQLEGIEAYNKSLPKKDRSSENTETTAEVWYLLDVAETRRNEILTIDLYYRVPKKDGSFGKLKRLNLNGDQLPGEIDAETIDLLSLLIGNQLSAGTQPAHYTPAARSTVELGAAFHEILLPRLCATGRFVAHDRDDESQVSTEPDFSGNPLRWDDGVAWRLAISLIEDEAEQRWSFRGGLERDGKRRSLEETSALLATGIAVFDDSLARLDVSDPSVLAWIVHLRGKAGISIPYTDRTEFLRTLYSMSELPRVELPGQLAVEEYTVPPQGRLRVRSPGDGHGGFRNALFAEVSFLYGEHSFSMRDTGVGRHDAGTGRAVIRDREHENRLLTELVELEMKRPAMSSYLRDEVDLYFHEDRLSEVVARLSAAGWMLEADGVEIRRPGPMSLRVSSGVDWFELDGRIDFGGAGVSLPRLLEAVRRKENFVRLDDGSRGILPQEWIDQYAQLARLGIRGEDHLRFTRSQAMLLDALLSEQENVSVDRGFAGFRARLAAMSEHGGVKPRSEPRGFRGALRDYQKDGHGWLHFLRELGFGGCLADDMGLGKTVQVLALLQARRARKLDADEPRRPSIVVVPKSLLFNWVDEAERFTPQLRIIDHSGADRLEKLAALRAGQFSEASEASVAAPGSVASGSSVASEDRFDVLLTTYGTMRRDITTLKEIRFDYAILDEAQAIKNSGSQAAKASRLIDADHRLAMTGTPVENHLGELWSLFEFLNPGLLGESRAFESMRRGSTDERTREMLSRALRPFLLRRTKQEVLTELPEKSEQTLHCVLSDEERQNYDELREYYRVSLAERIDREGVAKSRIHVLEALLRLRQASCHPGLLDQDRRAESSTKLDTLLEHVEEIVEEGHKALIFSQFTSLLSILRDELDRRGTVYEYLDGRTRDRAARVKHFQEDASCPLFLISLKAGGQGLNLTAADYVYILDPWWNPAVEAQAIDRAHRIGQDRHVFAYRLIARDTVEEKIVELQRSKRELADAIVSGDRGPIGGLSAEDVDLLFAS